MNETQHGTASASAGSAGTSGSGTAPDSGQAPVDLSQFVEKSVYEALEKKLGEQGQELGQKRATLAELEPLMSILENNPEVIKAIMKGQIDNNLATAVMEGKITLAEAKAVTQEAADEITKTMENTPNQAPVDIDKLVDDKLQALLGEKLDAIKSEVEDIKVSGQLQQEIDSFIAETPDIGEYADKIQEYLDANPWVQNIEVAYHVVKGKTMSELQEKAAADKQAEAEKQAALNVAGGGSNPGADIRGDDGLIPSMANPNNWAG